MSTQMVLEPATIPASPQTAVSSLVIAQRPLFSQSFVEASGTERRRRRRSALFSLTVQAIILGVFVVMPLLVLEVLPAQQLATFLVAPPPPPPPPPPAPDIKSVPQVSEIVNGQLMVPSKIPKTIKMIKEEESPPQASQGGVLGGVVGGVPGGSTSGVLGAILEPVHTAPVVAVPKRLKISSGVSEGLLLQRVEPQYPPLARSAHLEGTVQLRALISKEGTIENLQAISGHPFLLPAAIAAVKQWHYRPYMLNGEPLEIETIVIVNFHLH